MDLATWCPNSEDWDVNIDRFYFTPVKMCMIIHTQFHCGGLTF